MKTYPSTSPLRSGFTLIESLMSVLIVSGVLVAALGTFGAIGKARQTQVERAAAMRLADELMAEILQCYFQEPSGGTTIGTDAGETSRAHYDDVDDYHNWQASPPTARDGTALTGYAGWKRKVRVEHARVDDPKVSSTTATGLKQIRVTVTTATGISYEVSAVRSSGGAYEQLPSATTTYLTWAGVAVKVGADGKTVYGAAHPLNVATSQ